VIEQDRDVVDRTLAGDRQAFNVLILRYQDRLLNSVERIIHHPEDAAEVVQEAFWQAYLSLPRFKGESQFYTWLFRIAFNLAMTRKRRRRPQSLEEVTSRDPGYEPVDPRQLPDPLERLEQEESTAMLEQAIRELGPDQRAVIVLKDLDGLKYEQIAELLEVPIGTVRSRLHRARWELKQILELKWGTTSPLPSSEAVDSADLGDQELRNAQ